MASYEVKADVTGSVWIIVTTLGQTLEAGQTIMVIESMKMEIPVIAEEGGTIREFRVEAGNAVVEGQVLAVVER